MQVNGKQTPTPRNDRGETVSLKDFLETSGYDPSGVAIEKNGAIVDKKAPAFAAEPLRDDDVLEIVYFMGGG
ncbi:MAG: sulfur carrier protein ThiS [Chitinispirillales bacterium]|jgi:thiamine biosynthesis protein ThiS|nr:sulfur carrier protein ThiS [Chitinispirillales bacterium]